MVDMKAWNKFSFESVRMKAWKVYSVGKGIFFFNFSMSSRRKNMYLLTKCVGRTENIWLKIIDVPNMTEYKIFSCLTRTNSVNKHFIM